MKKIIFCVNNYPPNFVGGAELIAHHQAKALQRLGHQVIIFSGDSHPYKKRYSIDNDVYEGLTVYRVQLENEDYNYRYNNFRHIKVENQFKTLLHEFAPDVIHIHNMLGLSLGIAYLAKMNGIKTIMTLHDTWGFCFKGTLLRNDETICEDYTECEKCMAFFRDEDGIRIPIRMRRDYFSLALNEIDEFITPSNSLAEYYIQAGFPRRKFTVIRNGIDVERFSKVTRTDNRGIIRFSFIGVLGRHKGLHVLIDALKHIDPHYKFHVNIVGSGPELKRVKEQATSVGKENLITFWGKVDNSVIEEVYRETDVMLIPSICPDVQPGTEAMASRIPIIGSNIGGIPELVEDGKTGFLFESGNAGELAEKMSKFMDRKELLETFGANGYKKISNYTYEHQVKKILRVYNKRDKSIPRSERPMVVCFVSPEKADFFQKCYPIIRRFDKNLRFVMGNWLIEDQIPSAKIIWVIDEYIRTADLRQTLRYKIPFLVPEHNEALRSFCIKNNCGLYYRNAREASECINYLISHSRESAIIGNNAYNACEL